MSKRNDKAIQLEILPTGKTERALDWREMVTSHAGKQDKLYNAFYGLLANKVKQHNEGIIDLSIGEIKQAMDGLRNAGSWTKQVSEALQISEQSLNDARIANKGNLLDLSTMSDKELDKLLEYWV